MSIVTLYASSLQLRTRVYCYDSHAQGTITIVIYVYENEKNFTVLGIILYFILKNVFSFITSTTTNQIILLQQLCTANPSDSTKEIFLGT